MTVPDDSANWTADILKNARRLRDFGLLQPMDGFPELVGALSRYEARAGDGLAEIEGIQLAMSRVGASFEPENLNALLRRDLRLPTDSGGVLSPWMRFTQWLAVFFPITLGFLFLIGSLYFTRLTLEGAGLVAKMNAVLAVDLQAKSDSIVTMLRPLLPPESNQTASDSLGKIAASSDQPATIRRTAIEALHALEDLRNHVTLADMLMNDILLTNAVFGLDDLRRSWSEVRASPAVEAAPEQVVTAIPQPVFAVLLESLQWRTNLADIAGEEEAPVLIPTSYPALEEHNAYLKQVRQFIFNGRGLAYVSPQFQTMMYARERDRLLSYIDITNKWLLPVLYGALGAVLYVLARHFNPFMPSLNLGRVLLRITFAMFVAVTISMLFIPANVVTPIVTSSPSGIFLLCFIAGYSTDTFIRFLGKLNTYFAMPAQRNPAS